MRHKMSVVCNSELSILYVTHYLSCYIFLKKNFSKHGITTYFQRKSTFIFVQCI